MIFQLLVASIAALYAGAALYLARGIRARYGRRDDLPAVTIVVPVRNEAAALPGLLESLAGLDYPPDRIELILVDDQSTDKTVEVAEAYRARLPFPLRIIDVMQADVSMLSAKTRPLAAGIEAATTEFILMTDADCRVNPDWARGMVSYFADGVGMVCGVTLPQSNPRVPRLSRFEMLDWLFLIGSCAAFSGRRNPQALIGNNYAVRSSTYRRLGTYRRIPHNKVDDIALMLAVKNEDREQVVMPADPAVVVRTQPLDTLGELVGQRYRWLKAWPFAKALARLVLLAGIVMHVGWPVVTLLAGPAGLVLLAGTMIGDGTVIHAMSRRCAPAVRAATIPLYPLFATLYGWWLVILILTGKRIEWKDREF